MRTAWGEVVRVSGETSISRAIAKAVADLGFKVLRLHSGKVKVRGGYMRHNERGTPDRCVLLSGGSVVFLEVKKPGGKVREKQAQWHRDVARWGHRVAVVDSVGDAVAAVLEAEREARGAA